MTTDRDDAPMRRYREASDVLDERPSAGTRATILAAATRQVEARPHAADAPRVVRRPRWPLAAAAAVLLSTLAVMMATRTEEEMPSFTAPAERAPEAVAAGSAPAATATAPSSSAAPPVPPGEAPAVTARKAAPAKEREEGPLIAAPTERMEVRRSDASSAAASASSAEPAPDSASAEAREASPAASAATAPAPLPAAPLSRSAPAPAAAGAMRAPDLGAAAKPQEPLTDRASAQEAAPVRQGAARLDNAQEIEGSAPAWLERIVKLRGEGRHAEADAELKRFRERYPEIQVPPAALPGAPSGTR